MGVLVGQRAERLEVHSVFEVSIDAVFTFRDCGANGCAKMSIRKLVQTGQRFGRAMVRRRAYAAASALCRRYPALDVEDSFKFQEK
jgi:hypothetical protein